MASCSFGKVSLRGTFLEFWPFGTELYARMFYVKSDDGTQALLVAMDLACTCPAATDRFREGVAAATGIHPDHIIYHELQIHAAPGADVIRGETVDRIVERVVPEIKTMMQNAVPFTCDVCEAYAGTRFSYNREQYVHGLGGVTVWAGLKYDETGRPYSQDPDRMLLRGYKPDLPVFDKPIYFDNPNDPLAYLFVFRDTNGGVIGTMSRFAAHPDIGVLFESHHVSDYKFHFDWTGYLSEYMEAAFHAPAMYINGPCANLAMKKGFEGFTTYEKSDEECKRVGEELAAYLVEEFHKHHVSLGDPNTLKVMRFQSELPLKDDFPRDPEKLTRDIANWDVYYAQEALDAAIARGDSPAAIKTLIDDRFRATYRITYMDEQVYFDEDTLRRGTAMANIAVMQLGDYVFIGIPGESMTEMSTWMRSTFTGVKTIPMDQVDGYMGYMATPTSMTLGGYTYWNSWVSREAIPKMKDDMAATIRAFLAEE